MIPLRCDRCNKPVEENAPGYVICRNAKCEKHGLVRRDTTVYRALIGLEGDPETESPQDTTEHEIIAIIGDLQGLLLSKHRDYGTQNLDEFGSMGILIRVSDKLNRLKNLIKNPDKARVAESLEDTWLDIAGYAVQAVRYTRRGE